MRKTRKKSGTRSKPYKGNFVPDQILLPYYIQVVKVHAKGLQKINILKKEELRKITAHLTHIAREFKKHKIKKSGCEQAIRKGLTKKYKTLGKKALTALHQDLRITAERLYMKDSLEKIKKSCKKLAGSFLKLAQNHKNTKFERSTIGHFACSIIESLMNDIAFLDSTSAQINQNPLGSTNGFGSDLLLDREYTAKELGFKKIQINSLYCKNSTEKFERIYNEALSQITLTLEKFIKVQKLEKQFIKNTQISIENLEAAQKSLKKLTKNLKNTKPSSKNSSPKLKSLISLGAPGNLDIFYYKNKLKKL